MSYVHDKTGKATTWAEFRSYQERRDANGKRWIKAYTHASLTAASPYALVPYTYGYQTAALFDTGQTTGSAGGLANMYVGFPSDAVESGVMGWLQVEGYIASATTSSTSGSLGAYCRWTIATILNAAVSSLSGLISDFAIFIDTDAKATAHELVLLGHKTAGTT